MFIKVSLLVIVTLVAPSLQAASLCGGLLGLKTPSKFRALLPGIDSIPAGQLVALEQAYTNTIAPFETFRVHSSQSPLSKIVVGEVHAENFFKGVPHSKVMHDWGFKFLRTSEGGFTMEKPASIFEIFEIYENRMREWVKTGVVSEQEVLHPAFVLENTNGFNDYRVFSPAIDKWPGDNWIFAASVPQFSHELYYRFVASGRMPFAVGNFLNHDLSHLSDMYQNPEVMRHYLRYGNSVARLKAKSGNRAAVDEKGFTMTENPQALRAEYRSVIYAEWFTLPDIKKADLIRSLLPKYFKEGGVRSFKDAIAQVEELSPEEKKARVQRLVDNSQVLIIRLGGGMKDVRSYYSFDAFGPLVRMMGIFQPEKRMKPNFAEYSSTQALVDSLPKMIDLLDHLSHFVFDTPSALQTFLESKPEYEHAPNFEGLMELKESEAHASARDNARVALNEMLARIETAFYKAVELSLTPEIAYREGRVRRLSTQSLYFQYLKSFMPEDSYTALAFELNRPQNP